MIITIKSGEKVRNFSLSNPAKGKVTKLKNAVKSVFKKAKGTKKPKADEILINTLQGISSKLDNLATKIENSDK